MSDPSPDCECGHSERTHHATPSGRFPCAHVKSGTSTRGIVGLSYSCRCSCDSYRPKPVIPPPPPIRITPPRDIDAMTTEELIAERDRLMKECGIIGGIGR